MARDGNGRARVERWRDSSLVVLVTAGCAVIPLLFVRGIADNLHVPKALALRGEAILIAAAVLLAVVFGAKFKLQWRDRTTLLPAAALAVFALVALTSTNRTLSTAALAAASATFAVYLGTLAAARTRAWILVSTPLAAAVVNAILAILEQTHVWMPFGEDPAVPHHIQCTALLGNPNELGSYLGTALLVCLALFVSTRGRLVATIGAAVLAAGLIASQTLTAMIALTCAVIAMAAMSSWRRALGSAIALAVVAVLLIAVIPPLRHRAAYIADVAGGHDYNELLSERLTPFAAAWSMFADHPLTGAGPATFAWHYFDYKLAAEQRHPSLRRAYNRGVNYGEVHNDHLQVLAEGGIAGYAAFAALLIALGSLSFIPSRDDEDPRMQFARRLALPLAVFWTILSIAQFPLETTAVRLLLVHFSAVCAAWRSV